MGKKYWIKDTAIIGLVLFLSNSTSTFALVMRGSHEPSEMVREAEIIFSATVLSTQCQWKDDDRGKHIYTHVELLVDRMIKGDLPSNPFFLEVVGGTMDDIAECVSHSPFFRTAEHVLLLLDGPTLQPVGGKMGKMPILDGHVLWGSRKVSLESLSRSIALGIEIDFIESEVDLFNDESNTMPQITSIIPDIGSAGTDTEVTISGTGFGEIRDYPKVEFFYQKGEPRIEGSVISWSDTQIICTVPTGIINDYAASAGSGPVTVTTRSGTSNEYPFRVTFSHDGQYWSGENPVIPYYINENTFDCTGEGAAVQAAAETWNRTGGSFRFRYAGSHTSMQTSRNSRNEIMWGSTPSGALAVVYSWLKHTFDTPGRSPARHQIVECDMVFNDRDANWSTNPSISEADVQSIALHEFGHFLRLLDIYGDIGDSEYDAAKVMYGFSDGSTLKRSLHPDDIAGLHWIYHPNSPPDTPIYIDYPTKDDGVYTVNWNASSAASSYQLERSMDGGDWVQIYSGPHTFFEETVEDGNYRYRVTASNITGSGDFKTGDWECFVQLLIWEGRGEPNDPFLVATAEQLDRIGTHSRWWNKHFKLTADIDLSDYDGLDGRPAFHTIAPNDDLESWIGVFDGNDHTISGLTYVTSEPGHAGLFGCVDGPDAQVKRLGLIGLHIEHTNARAKDRVGGLVGLLKEGSITACFVEDAGVSGARRVGGLVGENVNGTIVDCYANVSIYGADDVGGLVGYNSGHVSASFSTGTLTGSGWGIGGVAGSNNPQGTIIHGYSSASIQGRERVGGLVGENRKGTVIQCYSTGFVSGEKGYVGGLIGDNLNGYVEASFWDIQTSGKTTSAGGFGTTTDQMHRISTYLQEGWDFVDETENGVEDIWWIDEGNDYPRLWWELREDDIPVNP